MRGEWPDGWARIPLAEAGKWLSGGTPSTANSAYWDGDIPWISAASLKEFRIDRSDRRVTSLGADSGSRLVDKGAVLFVVRGMSLKSEFRIGVTERQVAFGQDCKALIAADGIDPHFLAHAVQTRTAEILAMVEETSHGTGRLDTERLQELEIGVPPMSEQRKIVAANAVVERRIKALERVRDKMHETGRAVVAAALAAADIGARVPLESLLREIQTGWSPACDVSPPAVDQWGVVRVSAVTSGHFRPSESKRLPTTLTPKPGLEIRPGDVLVARANGARSLVGVACYVEDTRPKLMLSDKILRIIPDPSQVDAKFLSLLFGSSVIRDQVAALLNGGSGQNNISQEDIRGVRVPNVPLKEQRRIVDARKAQGKRSAAVDRQILKLRALQQGLMEDLLSGRVSVS
ncbi:restriction endonuclease subunit S [Streptomyces collinus]|uniref:restriction endonuclease subunit S n=1 Tax=Streptomyces collinus TaxID=42684 RepID=UPI00367EB25F